MFNDNCSKHLVPEDFLSKEKSLYSTRVKIGFKQFNPSKPAKYGVIIKSINFARYTYMVLTHACCGKPKHELFVHWVCGTEAVVNDLVIHFYDLQGRNITETDFIQEFL